MRVPLLSIELVNGCNLRCVGCSHGSPDEPSITNYDIRALANDLDRMVLQPKVIELVGGEPTLHPNLDTALSLAKTITPRVRLITNGARLSRWEHLEFDEVWHSKYPGQPERTYNGPARFTVIDRSLFRVQYGVPENTETTYRECRLAHLWKCIVLKGSRLFRCGPSMALGGVGVDPGNLFEVRRLLDSQPDECSRCQGTSGPVQRWSQMQREQRR